MWRQFNREEIKAAKCTAERVMRRLAIQGAVRGRGYRTTVPDHAGERFAKASIECSVGSFGDSYANALAETIVGLY